MVKSENTVGCGHTWTMGLAPEENQPFVTALITLVTQDLLKSSAFSQVLLLMVTLNAPSCDDPLGVSQVSALVTASFLSFCSIHVPGVSLETQNTLRPNMVKIRVWHSFTY